MGRTPSLPFNIMSQYNNNTFIYSGLGMSLFNVTFPDGFYDVDTDMNYYLQQVMLANGHYLVNNDTGENVYYIKISTNRNRYKCQLDFFTVPTTLPANYSNPANWNIAGLGGRTLLVNFNGGFNSLIGFDNGTYGNVLVNTSYLSQNVPSPALVNSYLITVPTIVSQSNINLNNNSALYAKTPDVDFGNNIIFEPTNLIWLNINQGSYSFIDVIIASGDDGLPLTLQDSNSLIMLVVKSKNE